MNFKLFNELLTTSTINKYVVAKIQLKNISSIAMTSFFVNFLVQFIHYELFFKKSEFGCF